MFEFIEAEKANYPIIWMCDRLEVSRASFYRWRKPPDLLASASQRRHAMLVREVFAVYEQAGGRVGRRQIHWMLRNRGIDCAEGTVGAIMRELGIQAIRVRAWKQTTTRDPGARTAHIKNHMVDDNGHLDFSSVVPGLRLCGDITYLKTDQGWSYLATVIDLFNGEIIGWALDSHMRTDLIVEAFMMARDRGRLAGGKVIFHSDRGSQYTSGQFQKWCEANKITQSMGDVGNCWQNAVAESFFSHMKTEMFHQQSWATRQELRTAMIEYIEIWYNRQRPHTRASGYPPVHARDTHNQASQPLAA